MIHYQPGHRYTKKIQFTFRGSLLWVLGFYILETLLVFVVMVVTSSVI